MKTNSKVDDFIEDLQFLDEGKREIVISLKELVLKIAPESKEEIKYGGLVFFIGSRLFSGIFVRKNHISLEFDRGAEIEDCDNFLEGGGKYRRHLKLLKNEDIKNKKSGYYIRQCFKLS